MSMNGISLGLEGIDGMTIGGADELIDSKQGKLGIALAESQRRYLSTRIYIIILSFIEQVCQTPRKYIDILGVTFCDTLVPNVFPLHHHHVITEPARNPTLRSTWFLCELNLLIKGTTSPLSLQPYPSRPPSASAKLSPTRMTCQG